MGMDYQYAGSASYPRFDRELCEVASVFGGKLSEHTEDIKNTENERPLGYWFGFISSDEQKDDKFVFPEGTDKTLVRWFNNIYSGCFSLEDTKHIFELIKQHPEIESISPQIWEELKCLSECGDGWFICQ